MAREQGKKYFQRGFYNSNIQTDWTPIFEVERTFLYKYKKYQRIQFPLRPAAAKTVHKGQGITEDEVVVDLTQNKGVRKVPHIHYVAFSRVRKLENLFILNINEAAIGLIYRVTDQALIAETAVWPNVFLMNIFFALKGSKLFIIIR